MLNARARPLNRRRQAAHIEVPPPGERGSSGHRRKGGIMNPVTRGVTTWAEASTMTPTLIARQSPSTLDSVPL
jgi:hypothetical protein